MKIKHIKLRWMLLGGWPVILTSAAIFLPRTDVSNAVAYPIILLMAAWFLLSVVTLFFYFYRAYRPIRVVSNKAAYITWLSLESVFALAAIAGIVWFFVTPS